MDSEFQIKLSESERRSTMAAIVAGGCALLMIAGIFVLSTSDISSSILPMREEYLDLLIPVATDGAEPLALRQFDNRIDGPTVAITGSVANRTATAMPDLLAVLTVADRTGLNIQTSEFPVSPATLEVNGSSTFEGEINLGQGALASVTVRFKIKDGPFIPHRDERAPTMDISIQEKK